MPERGIHKPKSTVPPPPGDRLSLRYLHGGMANYRAGEVFGPRWNSDFELVWIISGRVRYETDGTIHATPPGSMILTRPGHRDRFYWDPHGDTRHAYLHFDMLTAPRDWPPLESWPTYRAMPEADAVRPMVRRMITRWAGHAGRNRDRRPPRVFETMLETVLDHLLDAADPDDHRADRDLPDAVQRALDWANHRVQMTPDAPIVLDDLAEAASVSAKHLCRLFRQCLGRTPMEVVRLMRLERSVSLLARSNLTVHQIAGRCGFASPYHFSRCFTQTFGDPPTVIRRKIAQGQPPPASPLGLGVWGAFTG